MKKTQGFTLVETLIVTAVLGIVMVMAFPNFTAFFSIQKEKSEGLVMSKIRDAMAAHMDAEKKLPDPDFWADELSAYSDLSVQDIEKDVWGNFRVYQRREDSSVQYRDTDVTVPYAMVYSYGENNCYGLGCVDDARDLPSDFFNDVSKYPQLAAEDGDYLVKFSGYQDVVKNYKTTLERMEKISAALSTYAFSRLDAAISAGFVRNAIGVDVEPEKVLYYPPTDYGSGDDHQYSEYVVDDLNAYAGIFAVTINAGTFANDYNRYLHMRGLMRLLGLPEETCCSALTTFEYDGTVYEFPFFYYSNPRARQSASFPPVCGTRPDVSAGDRTLPPRISLLEDSAACG